MVQRQKQLCVQLRTKNTNNTVFYYIVFILFFFFLNARAREVTFFEFMLHKNLKHFVFKALYFVGTQVSNKMI